jgi:peptidyl-prolyl cis-trans isomerase B (cyclophilin B)
MKKILITLLCTLSGLNLATAAKPASGEVALITIRIDKQDKLLHAVLEFDDGDAPQTVENFKKLSRKGFYNGIAFHRVFAHTLVQAGDPLSRRKNRARVGTGGPGYTLPPEIHRKHTAGAVAMSRLPDNINPGRVSSGSQFYVCLKPMPNLDGQYTVFAHVAGGLEDLDKVSQLPADSNDNPIGRAVIKSIKLLSHSEAEARIAKDDHPSKFLHFLGR